MKTYTVTFRTDAEFATRDFEAETPVQTAKDRYIIEAIQNEDTECVKAGQSEYQVSDGLPGERSYSCDFPSLDEAIAYCKENNWTYKIRLAG
jgi:hypothetical protein